MGHLQGALDRTAAGGLRTRTTMEVILDHLECRRRKAIDEDIARNYALDVTVMSRRGARRGATGVRAEADELGDAVPDLRFRITSLVANGQFGFIEWSGRGRDVRAEDGADSFVVRDGRIVCQTISYDVRPDGAGR